MVASLLISIAAFAISLVALWKNHFSPFSPLALAGPLAVRIYPFRSGTKRWFVPSLSVPVSITNAGAQPGMVTGLRLRLHFPLIPIPDNCEYIEPQFEISNEHAQAINGNRFEWLDKIVVGHWMPFTVLPKATVTKHFVFESRWEDPVIQDAVMCTLQILSGTNKWQDAVTWKLNLGTLQWSEHVNRGTSISYISEAFDLAQACVPADLHKHTVSKEPIPPDGLGAQPSYLDYPDGDAGRCG